MCEERRRRGRCGGGRARKEARLTLPSSEVENAILPFPASVSPGDPARVAPALPLGGGGGPAGRGERPGPLRLVDARGGCGLPHGAREPTIREGDKRAEGGPPRRVLLMPRRPVERRKRPDERLAEASGGGGGADAIEGGRQMADERSERGFKGEVGGGEHASGPTRGEGDERTEEEGGEEGPRRGRERGRREGRPRQGRVGWMEKKQPPLARPLLVSAPAPPQRPHRPPDGGPSPTLTLAPHSTESSGRSQT